MGYSRNNSASSSGVTAGDKGDITVASNGTWTIDNLAVTNAKINDVDATKVTQSASNRFVTDTEKSTWNEKQDALGFTPLNSSTINIINGNQTTTSNLASNITELFYSASANIRYNINGFIRIGCNNNGGVKINLTVPSGATFNLLLFGIVATTPTFSSSLLSTSGTLSQSFITANNTNGWVIVKGEVNMSSTAGNIQFGFASGTNNQTSTIFKLGTFLNIIKIN